MLAPFRLVSEPSPVVHRRRHHHHGEPVFERQRHESSDEIHPSSRRRECAPARSREQAGIQSTQPYAHRCAGVPACAGMTPVTQPARSCRNARWRACAPAPRRPRRAGSCGRSAGASLPASTAPHRSARMAPHDLAHLLDRARAEGDADVVDALQRVQVEVELALDAAEAADVDDAPEHGGGLHVRVRHAGRHLVDDQVHALACRSPRAPRPASRARVVSMARSAPNSLSRSRRMALVEVPITSARP